MADMLPGTRARDSRGFFVQREAALTSFPSVCHRVESGGAFASGQWSVDDVTIGPAQCTPG
jgi:hypothetical protein